MTLRVAVLPFQPLDLLSCKMIHWLSGVDSSIFLRVQLVFGEYEDFMVVEKPAQMSWVQTCRLIPVVLNLILVEYSRSK